MKIIAFLGSPRKDGNSALLLKETIRGIAESGLKVQIFNLNEMNISPCQSCGGCEDTGVCIFNDDMALDPCRDKRGKQDNPCFSYLLFRG